MFTLNTLEECECVANQGGIGGQSTVSSFIEAQHRGTEEIERLTMLVAQKDAEIDVLKAAQSSEVPGKVNHALLTKGTVQTATAAAVQW
ncbi:hypothetical protein HAX54_022105 [Datura stramonium]|uniref:Uncharacterized protein n=1 Tax=Datura stramonium TaxID=4076 RepID=A0ABS8UTY9_DATST|nr:hypothetical protein [Datura stramonium]